MFRCRRVSVVNLLRAALAAGGPLLKVGYQAADPSRAEPDARRDFAALLEAIPGGAGERCELPPPLLVDHDISGHF